ncbi:MAG: rod shape-determining protein MreD [Sphingobium sp.]
MIPAVPRLGSLPSRWRLQSIPICAIMLGSMMTALPIISQSPSMPPFGLLILLAWRLLHPEMLPLWIGAPLGAFDDVMSGQPIGTAVFLWSLMLICIEVIDQRIFWRDYWHDWLMVVGALVLCIGGALLMAHIAGSRTPPQLIVPQIIWSALTYPLIVRLIARLDRWRIMA